MFIQGQSDSDSLQKQSRTGLQTVLVPVSEMQDIGNDQLTLQGKTEGSKKKGLHEFLKGIFYDGPINMIKGILSPMGLITLAGSVALGVMTGGAAIPLLVAGGLVAAGLQLGKGILSGDHNKAGQGVFDVVSAAAGSRLMPKKFKLADGTEYAFLRENPKTGVSTSANGIRGSILSLFGMKAKRIQRGSDGQYQVVPGHEMGLWGLIRAKKAKAFGTTPTDSSVKQVLKRATSEVPSAERALSGVSKETPSRTLYVDSDRVSHYKPQSASASIAETPGKLFVDTAGRSHMRTQPAIEVPRVILDNAKKAAENDIYKITSDQTGIIPASETLGAALPDVTMDPRLSETTAHPMETYTDWAKTLKSNEARIDIFKDALQKNASTEQANATSWLSRSTLTEGQVQQIQEHVQALEQYNLKLAEKLDGIDYVSPSKDVVIASGQHAKPTGTTQKSIASTRAEDFLEDFRRDSESYHSGSDWVSPRYVEHEYGTAIPKGTTVNRVKNELVSNQVYIEKMTQAIENQEGLYTTAQKDHLNQNIEALNTQNTQYINWLKTRAESDAVTYVDSIAKKSGDTPALNLAEIKGQPHDVYQAYLTVLETAKRSKAAPTKGWTGSYKLGEAQLQQIDTTIAQLKQQMQEKSA